MHRILITFLLLTAYELSYGQEWILQPGEAKVFTSYTYLSYDRYADPDGNFYQSEFLVTDQTISLFGTYGLNDRMTIYGSLPFKLVQVEQSEIVYIVAPEVPAFLEDVPVPEGGNLQALGNATAGLSYALVPGSWTASLTLEANTSTQNYIDGTATGFNSHAVIPGIAWIHGTDKWWSSVLLQGEYRTNGYSPVIGGRAEYGIRIMPWMYLAASPGWRIPVGDGGEAECDCSLPYTAMYLDQQSWVTMQLKAGFEHRNWGFHLASGNGFYVRNVGLNIALTGGLSYHFPAASSSE